MHEHFVDAPSIKCLQIVTKLRAHLLCWHALLPFWQFVMLVDVVVLQPLKRCNRRVQACGRHAPGADGRTNQIHRLVALGQPLPEQKPVQGPEDQTLGATRRSGNHAHVMRQKTVRREMCTRPWACINVKRLHSSAPPYLRKP